MKESAGFDTWLWIEKAPPMMISPSLDNSGNSGLPIIWQSAASSSTPKALRKSTDSNVTQIQSLILYRRTQTRICVSFTEQCVSFNVLFYTSDDDDDGDDDEDDDGDLHPNH